MYADVKDALQNAKVSLFRETVHMMNRIFAAPLYWITMILELLYVARVAPPDLSFIDTIGGIRVKAL